MSYQNIIGIGDQSDTRDDDTLEIDRILSLWTEACPDPETLLAVFRGELPEGEIDVRAHLLYCPFCKSSWDDMVKIKTWSEARIREAEPLQSSRRLHIHGIPAFGMRLVERSEEVQDVEQRLFEHGFVQITGPQGTGKTSIAIEIAQRPPVRFLKRVAWVDLRGLDITTGMTREVLLDAIAYEFDLIVPASATEEGMRRLLARHLQNRTALLILDNCERIYDEAAWVIQVLREDCPFVEILATSRIALSLPMSPETRFEMSPLSPEEVLEVVRQAMPDSIMGHVVGEAAPHKLPAEATEIHQWLPMRYLPGVCSQIPLLLLLVASLPEWDATAFEDLQQRLTGKDVAQDVETTIGWRLNLLPPSDRQVLQLIALLSGGCPRDVLGHLAERNLLPKDYAGAVLSLQNQKLIRPETKEQFLRFRIHEAIREVLLRESRALPQIDAWSLSLMDFYTTLAKRLRDNAAAERGEAMQRLRAESFTINELLQWCRKQPGYVREGLRLAKAMSWFWAKDVNLHFGKDMLEYFLKQAEKSSP